MTHGAASGAATVLAALAAAGAVLALTAPDPGPTRIAALAPPRSDRPSAVVARSRRGEDRGRGVATLAAGAGVVAFVGGIGGLVLGAITLVGTHLWLRRLEPRAVVAEREQMARDLPVAVHLLAGAIGAGAPPVAAIEVVGAVIEGPVAVQLRRVAAQARLGGDLAAIWQSVPEETGMGPLARTVARALQTGAPLAGALDRLALDLRSHQRSDVERRARSVGVRAAIPLGLCFLPAFLLVGVVPVVIGVATTIFATIR